MKKRRLEVEIDVLELAIALAEKSVDLADAAGRMRSAIRNRQALLESKRIKDETRALCG